MEASAEVAGKDGTGSKRTPSTRSPSVQAVTAELFSTKIESPASRRLLLAAIECFWKSGFAAASTRDIAKKAKLSNAAVYTHFKTKDDLLFTIIQVVISDMLEKLQKTAAEDGDAKRRLWRIVQDSVAIPARIYKAGVVVNSEYAALGSARRAFVSRVRDQLDAIVEDCLREGCASGQFQIDDISVTRTAIVTLCRTVVTFYSPKGRLTPEELGAAYGDLVLRMVKAE